MEIKYTGMELKLHRHGIRTALASVFRGDADRHARSSATAHWRTAL